MTPDSPSTTPAPVANHLIEQHGVDIIPEAERTSTVRDLVSILFGSNLAFGVVVFGWLPVSFGLSFWGSASSLLVGTVVGIALVAPLALISLRTATNLSTSSGAHFGVRGRLIGSLVGLLLSLGYTALALWVGGDAIVGSLHRMLDMPGNGVSYALTYGVLAALSATGAVFGYRLMLRLEKVLMWSMTVLLVLGALAFAAHFHPSAHGHYLLGSYWKTWLLSAVSAGLSGPIAFITLLGDYTRYVSPARVTNRKVFWANCLGLLLGLLVPQLFGTFTAVAAGAGGNDYMTGLVAAAPAWYLIFILVNGVMGSAGNSGLMLYSMGLDLDAILPRATRLQATYVVAALATVLVFLGHFTWNAQDAVTSFVLLLTAIGTPWAVITLIGFRRCRGRYDRESLQVLNRRTRGGVYWFRAGWNIPATVAWALGSAVGLLAVNTPVYQGPLLRLTGGIDISFVLSGLVAGVCYVLLANRATRAGHWSNAEADLSQAAEEQEEALATAG